MTSPLFLPPELNSVGKDNALFLLQDMSYQSDAFETLYYCLIEKTTNVSHLFVNLSVCLSITYLFVYVFPHALLCGYLCIVCL